MPHPEHDAGAPAGSHVDEGTIHAWLDDALPADERRTVEAHVAGCAPCAAAVAEARGLVAGASRILAALDGGLGAVSAAPPTASAASIAAARASRPMPRRWWTGANARAAAALLIVAGGSGILLTSDGPRAGSLHVADSTATQESVADLRVGSQLATPQSGSALRGAVAFDASHDSVAGPEARRGRAMAGAESRAAAAGRPVPPPSAPPAAPIHPASALAMVAPSAAPPTAPVAAAPAVMSRGVAGGVARPMAGEARTEAQAQRGGYSVDSLREAAVPGRPAELRVDLRKSGAALDVARGRMAMAPSARSFARGAGILTARDVAGCYRVTTSASAGELPALVRLDTAAIADGGRAARLTDASDDATRWSAAGWSMARTGAADAMVSIWWRTTFGRTQLDLTREGPRHLAGSARLPGAADGSIRSGDVRLVRVACAPDNAPR